MLRMTVVTAGLSVSLFLVSCSGEQTLHMDGNVHMDGNMKLAVEGPLRIEMKMEGPSVKYTGTFISGRSSTEFR
jgi:hypothetical protein